LAACGAAIQSSPDSTSPDATTNNQQVADFAIEVYQGQSLLGGERIEFSELLDQGKPVVLNLWAGLCPPCRLEMPDFEAVHQTYQDQVLVLGLDVGPFTNLGSREDGQNLVQELGVTYPIGTTPNADIVRNYELIGMPTTYFVTPEGQVIRQWTGLLTEEKLAELVQELLDASARS
jgi:thiol-disulfide isomerase/thioredoxin